MKKFRLLDICLPDYFRGHHNTVYAVPIDGTTTLKQVFDGLGYEIDSYELNEHSGFTYEEAEEALTLIRKVNRDRLEFLFRDDLHIPEENEEELESVYAYFTVEEY